MAVQVVVQFLKHLFSYPLSHKEIVLIFAIMGLLVIGASFATILYLFRKWRESKWGWCHCGDYMHGKVVLITGANSGIGLETARALAEKGAVVVLSCRSSPNAQKAIADIRTTAPAGELIFLELDLADYESIKTFVSRFLTKFKRLDVLINNAGVYFPPQEPPLTNSEGVEYHFAVNHLGHFLLTHLLTETIVATPQSRVLIVSSELYKSGDLHLHDLTLRRQDKKISTMSYYVNSKLANMLHARELNRRLRGRGVTVCSLSPGFVYTDLFRNSPHQKNLFKKIAFLPVAFLFMRSAAQGAQTSIHCASSHKIMPSDSALYYKDCAVAPIFPKATDDQAALQLWHKSVELLNL